MALKRQGMDLLGVSCGSGTEALAVESRWGQGC